MTTRIDRILNSIKTIAGDNVYRRVAETCDTSNVKTMLDLLQNTSGADTVAKVMKPCGSQCISGNTITKSKSIYAGAKNLQDFLERLNERRIGGGHLYLRDGKIIGIYEKCYCGIAKATKDLSQLYCHCSAGWYDRLFSAVLEKPVEVKKICTILDGAKRCEFEIIVQ